MISQLIDEPFWNELENNLKYIHQSNSALRWAAIKLMEDTKGLTQGWAESFAKKTPKELYEELKGREIEIKEKMIEYLQSGFRVFDPLSPYVTKGVMDESMNYLIKIFNEIKISNNLEHLFRFIGCVEGPTPFETGYDESAERVRQLMNNLK